MGAKYTIDTVNKLFIINSGVTTLDIKVDLYSDAKEDWESDLSLNKFRFPIRPVAGNVIDAGTGKIISPYYELLYGWRIRPPEENWQSNVIGQVFTTEGDNAFVNTVGDFNTFIQYTVGENSTTSASFDVDSSLEGSLSFADAWRVMLAVLAGKVSGAGTGVETFRNTEDDKNRVISTVDANGNRTIVILDGS